MSPYLIICANLYTMSSHSSYVNNLPTITCIYICMYTEDTLGNHTHTHIGWAPKKIGSHFFSFSYYHFGIVQIDSPFRCFDFMNTSRAHFYTFSIFNFFFIFILSLSLALLEQTQHTHIL